MISGVFKKIKHVSKHNNFQATKNTNKMAWICLDAETEKERKHCMIVQDLEANQR